MTHAITRSAAAAVAVAAVTLTGCSSSSTTSSKSDTAGASSSAAVSGSASASSPSGGASSAPAKANAAACTDIKQLSALNTSFGNVGKNLAKGRLLLVTYAKAIGKLADDAPQAISTPAHNLLGSVRVLQTAANNAKTITELNQKSQTDPKLKAAGATLTTEGGKIDTWAKTNCQ